MFYLFLKIKDFLKVSNDKSLLQNLHLTYAYTHNNYNKEFFYVNMISFCLLFDFLVLLSLILKKTESYTDLKVQVFILIIFYLLYSQDKCADKMSPIRILFIGIPKQSRHQLKKKMIYH